jgi:uncharacterized protein YgbK (DUF1537 family)
MLKVAVIADDLTGAADTGIQFRRVVSPVYLLPSATVSSMQPEAPAEAISVYTNTRGLSPQEAGTLAGEAAEAVNLLRPERVYKKIDSCMRGNVGAEADALIECLGLEASFIAPAFPSQGRTTAHDVHLVYGTPVAESEMGRDPVSPVTDSRLTALVAGRSRFPVGHLDLDVLGAGPQGLAEEAGRLIRSGVRHIVVDAVEQGHLDALVAVHLKFFPNTLLVGSAGLALSLARRLAAEPAPEGPPPTGAGDRHLFVCGSSSERLRQQVDRLEAAGGFDRLVLPPGLLAASGREGVRRAAVREAAVRLGRTDLILQIEPPSSQDPVTPAEAVVKGLAEFVQDLLVRTPVGTLFLSGGDTATAILSRIGIGAVRLEEEIQPGMVRGTMVGGLLDGRTVITKAGAFGEPDALLRLHRKHPEEEMP